MHQSSLRHLLDILEIPLRAVPSEHLPVLDEDQEAEDLHDAGRGCDDEAVLISEGKPMMLANDGLGWCQEVMKLSKHSPKIEPRCHPIPIFVSISCLFTMFFDG